MQVRVTNEKIYKPFISYIPCDNFLFSLLSINSENFYEIIMNNYITSHVKYTKDAIMCPRFDDSYMWNKFHCLDTVFISKHTTTNHTSDICNFLDDGFIILCCIDIFYVPPYSKYQKEHSSHEIMIYKRDSEKKQFYCKDFFTLDGYTSRTIDYQDIENSLLNYFKTNNNEYNTGLVAARINNNYNLTFNINNFINTLYTIIEKPYTKSNVYKGIYIFDNLVNYLQHTQTNIHYNDVRMTFDFFIQQYKLMSQRIYYLLIEQYITECTYKKLLNMLDNLNHKTVILRNKFLKIQMNNYMQPDSFNINNLINKIKIIKKEYFSFIKILINKCK